MLRKDFIGTGIAYVQTIIYSGYRIHAICCEWPEIQPDMTGRSPRISSKDQTYTILPLGNAYALQDILGLLSRYQAL
jgi:hypothetical protein